MTRMTPPIISFDMDGTLVATEFTDWVWSHGIPTLYSEKSGLSYEEAKAFVQGEYQKVGEGAIEWYDIKYWFQLFGIEKSWKALMKKFADKIDVYPDVFHILKRLEKDFTLVLTSNAGREFIDIEMKATGLRKYFKRIFSATSDFGRVKKTADFYRRICNILDISPKEITHVGDHYEFDYIVPQSLGIRAYYLDRSGKKTGRFIISDLRELEQKLY
jgi:HAD superfamily hydrolase (TIGR01549 family)